MSPPELCDFMSSGQKLITVMHFYVIYDIYIGDTKIQVILIILSILNIHCYLGSADLYDIMSHIQH